MDSSHHLLEPPTSNVDHQIGSHLWNKGLLNTFSLYQMDKVGPISNQATGQMVSKEAKYSEAILILILAI